MTDTLLKQKIQHSLDECRTHLKRMHFAKTQLALKLPFSTASIDQLTEEQVALLDQYLFRFAKLQDAMGARLFKQSLELVDDLPRGMPFLDQLQQLEKLGALRSAAEWQMLRQLRNSLSHEYNNEPLQLIEGLNQAFDRYDDMLGIFDIFSSYIAPYLPTK